MPKYRFIFIFSFLTINLVFSQNSNINRNEIQNLFKKSILNKNKSKINIGENSWKICIENNEDKIYLYETKFEKYSDCCKYINWTFYKKNKFIKNISNLCSEPPLSIVTTVDDWYEIVYKIEHNNLILIIMSKNTTEKLIVDKIEKLKNGKHRIKMQRY